MVVPVDYFYLRPLLGGEGVVILTSILCFCASPVILPAMIVWLARDHIVKFFAEALRSILYILALALFLSLFGSALFSAGFILVCLL